MAHDDTTARALAKHQDRAREQIHERGVRRLEDGSILAPARKGGAAVVSAARGRHVTMASNVTDWDDLVVYGEGDPEWMRWDHDLRQLGL